MDEDTVHDIRSKNPFAVFAPAPTGVAFESLEKGEKIILLLRAHPVTLVPTILAVVFLAVAPTLVPSILSILDIDIFSSFSARQLILMTAFWYLFTWGYAFYKFIIWYFNVYLLTNERIIDIDFRGLLHKETSFAHLNQIQDVNPKIIGFFGTLFHFGNVFIQTAAEKPEFEFSFIERPNEVAREILEQVNKESKEAPGQVE